MAQVKDAYGKEKDFSKSPAAAQKGGGSGGSGGRASRPYTGGGSGAPHNTAASVNIEQMAEQHRANRQARSTALANRLTDQQQQRTEQIAMRNAQRVSGGRMPTATEYQTSWMEALQRTYASAVKQRQSDEQQTGNDAHNRMQDTERQRMRTRMWDGGVRDKGMQPLSKMPEGIGEEYDELYKLLFRLPSDFSINDWDNLRPRAQLSRIQRTDLTREEQWKILNAPVSIRTLGNIQNLQLHQADYGLTNSERNHASRRLMELAQARLEANGADSPFLETKAKKRFLNMLEREEKALMEEGVGVRGQGREKPALTGLEFMRYDKNRYKKGNARVEPASKQQTGSDAANVPDAKSDYHFEHGMEAFNERDVVNRTNCYAYALDLTENPLTNEPFPDRKFGSGNTYGLQPGELSGRNGEWPYAVGEDGEVNLISQIKADAATIGKTILSYKEAMEKGYKEGYAIAIAINPEIPDYHIYRENGDGTWSDKKGTVNASVTSASFLLEPDTWFHPRPVNPPTDATRNGYGRFQGYYYVIDTEDSIQ